jgi:hypothetical protein
MEELTDVFRQYETGRNYKSQINLYNDVDVNERFYAGDQWYGLKIGSLPAPVLNMIKSTADYLISAMQARAIKMQFEVLNVPVLNNAIDMQTGGVIKGSQQADPNNPIDPAQVEQPNVSKPSMVATQMHEAYQNNPTTDNFQPSYDELRAVSQLLSSYTSQIWERNCMDMKMIDGLYDAFNSGDFILYFYWDDTIETGQIVKGDICSEILDNVNVYFGNPNCKDTQKQPYIIITKREMVENVKQEASNNGVSKLDLERISSDNEYMYQSGDRGKIELNDRSKVLTFTKLRKTKNADGFTTVKVEKSTKNCVIRKEWDLKLGLYPIAMMNWKSRKNSVHGVAETTGLIPNQVAVNKILAMEIVNVMNTAYPKMIINENQVDGEKVSNAVGAVLPVRDDVNSAIKYLQPPTSNGQSITLVEFISSQTKQEMGHQNTNLTRATSAMVIQSLRAMAAAPLENIQQRLFQMVKETGKIWVDFFINYYTETRLLKVESDGNTYYAPFNGKRYKIAVFDLKLDAGQGAVWTDATQIETLNALLQYGDLTPSEYVDRLPKGHLEGSAELSDKLRAKEQLQQQQMQAQIQSQSQGKQPQQSQQGQGQMSSDAFQDNFGKG